MEVRVVADWGPVAVRQVGEGLRQWCGSGIVAPSTSSGTTGISRRRAASTSKRTKSPIWSRRRCALLVDRIDPTPTDDHQHHITVGDHPVDVLSKVDSQRDGVDVEEHVVRPELIDKPIADAARDADRVLTPVRDEHPLRVAASWSHDAKVTAPCTSAQIPSAQPTGCRAHRYATMLRDRHEQRQNCQSIGTCRESDQRSVCLGADRTGLGASRTSASAANRARAGVGHDRLEHGRGCGGDRRGRGRLFDCTHQFRLGLHRRSAVGVGHRLADDPRRSRRPRGKGAPAHRRELLRPRRVCDRASDRRPRSPRTRRTRARSASFWLPCPSL